MFQAAVADNHHAQPGAVLAQRLADRSAGDDFQRAVAGDLVGVVMAGKHVLDARLFERIKIRAALGAGQIMVLIGLACVGDEPRMVLEHNHVSRFLLPGLAQLGG